MLRKLHDPEKTISIFCGDHAVVIYEARQTARCDIMRTSVEAPGGSKMILMLRRLLQPIWVLLAIIFLIEAWLWDHLEPIVARAVAAIPLRAVKQWLADRVDTLSPAMTLIVFVVPVIPLFPLKLVGLWLLMHEYWTSAIFTIVFAKFLGVGVTAFVFDVTRDKLLQMAWFERVYQLVLSLRAKAGELVDPIKRRIQEIIRGNGDGWSARFLRLIMRFRKSVQAR
jgi:hypothetical protein